MSVTISWTKEWSSSDDGTILNGVDLENIQTNIESHTHTEDVETTGNQTVAGTKTFSGIVDITGTFKIAGITTLIVLIDEFLCWESDTVSYDENLVYYR